MMQLTSEDNVHFRIEIVHPKTRASSYVMEVVCGSQAYPKIVDTLIDDLYSNVRLALKRGGFGTKSIFEHCLRVSKNSEELTVYAELDRKAERKCRKRTAKVGVIYISKIKIEQKENQNGDDASTND